VIDIGAWSPADGLILEPNALRAAKEQKQSLALTAGPGAGKTEMLAQRADFLLRTDTCPYPKRILAISFKVDACANLKDRVRRRCGHELAARFDSHTFHAFAKRVIDRFRVLLTGLDALNVGYTIGPTKVTREQIKFDELVPLAIQILTESSVARNAVRQTYSDVFLDEFQDCTDKQYQLVRMAFLGTRIRLTAVGDTKQKIMGWAGALEGIFETFSAEFSAAPLNMYRNFRSKPRLLRVQNELIRVLDPGSVMPPGLLSGHEGEAFVWRFENSRQEATAIAKEIAKWVRSEQIPPSDIAVLVSRQPDLYADHLMAELEAEGIPYRNEQQLQDLSAEPAARLVVDYLLCLYGDREPKAWVRLMSLLIPYSDIEDQSSARREIQTFLAERRKELKVALTLGAEPFDGWWESVNLLVKKIGIQTFAALSADYESPARLKEVIKDTKTRIEALMGIESDLPKALLRFSDDQAVRILTIHKSKGLEFDSVIILGVEEQTFWGKLDEERCAFFVGVSRAKRRLALTVSAFRERPPSQPYRWQERRTAHHEFVAYGATP
jgi:superfamily I DNA/RNA helicase